MRGQNFDTYVTSLCTSSPVIGVRHVEPLHTTYAAVNVQVAFSSKVWLRRYIAYQEHATPRYFFRHFLATSQRIS